MTRTDVYRGRKRAQRTVSLTGHTCELCSKKARVRHHRDGNVLNNNIENLQLLCYRCHYWIHRLGGDAHIEPV